MKQRLFDKVALVTGAGSGIGRAIALRFAHEGARVGINICHNLAGGNETLREVEDDGGEGLVLQADVSSDADVRDMIDRLLERFGHIDILVNNSGIGAANSPDRVVDISEEDWDRVMAVNLKGAMLTSKHAIPHMIDQGGGSIVNISSIRGLLGNPNLAAYCASKGGMALLSRQMAVQYAREGIRVNCIAPGFILSEMLAGYIQKQDKPDEAEKLFAKMAAQNRIGSPEEIAGPALFFASSASSFVTGVVFPVDGGYTANGVRSIL